MRNSDYYDVFISFKNSDDEGIVTKDKEIADRVYEFLVSKNLKVFYSARSLEESGTDDWEEELKRVLSISKIFVALSTQELYMQKGYCQWERTSFLAYRYTDTSKAIYAYISSPMKLNDLPDDIKKIECFQDEKEGVLERLYTRINNHLNRNSTSKRVRRVKRVAKKSKDFYIEREIDAHIKKYLSLNSSVVIFLHGQGGMGKSTLLKEFLGYGTKSHKPTILFDIQSNAEESFLKILLNNTKTTHTPNFDKLKEEIKSEEQEKIDSYGKEFDLLLALYKDFETHGLFMVDTFEKIKNINILSEVDFLDDSIEITTRKRDYRLKDYISNIVYLFIESATFLIAGRNSQHELDMDIDEEDTQELSLEGFSRGDIERYFAHYKQRPTTKQIDIVTELTHGNPLLVTLFPKLIKRYAQGWQGLDFDKIKRHMEKDKEFGLLFYLTHGILSHIEDFKDIWKLVIPRHLTQDLQSLLFGNQDIIEILEDAGLASARGDGGWNYYLHDDVHRAILNRAILEYKTDDICSWHDHKSVIEVHQHLLDFYKKSIELYDINREFEIGYHNIMLTKDFERDFDFKREKFSVTFLGALFLKLDEKIDVCKNWNNIESKVVFQYIKNLKDEKYRTDISSELYDIFSKDLALGVINSVSDIDYLLKLSKNSRFKKDWSVFYFLGIAYGNKKDYDKAINVYVKAIEINPEKDNVYYAMGYAYESKKKYEKAIRAYQKAVEINSIKDDAYFAMGNIYGKKKEYAKAIEAYKKAIQINPENSEAYNNLRIAYANIGNIYSNKKKYEKAIEAYQKAININHKDENLYIKLGNIFNIQNKYRKAIRTFRKILNSNNKNYEVYNGIGISYEQQKQYDKAIEYYKKAIELNPKKEVYDNMENAYNDMGDFYSNKREYEKAIEAYEKAIEINPKNDVIHIKLGNIFNLKDEYKKAIETFNKILKYNNKSYGAYNGIGISYKKQKKYEKAIEAYEKAIEISPKNDNAYNNFASLYNEKKEYDRVIEVYQRIVKINPKNSEIYYTNIGISYDNMGDFYSNKREYEKAIEAYEKAVEINPKNDEAYVKMSRLYIDFLKKYEEGINCTIKAIEINPKNDSAYDNMGVAYKNKKEYDKAIEAYEKAVEINPKNNSAYNHIGYIYKNTKKYEKAIESYEKAIEINPKNYNVYNNIGYIYENTKKYEKAIEAYEKALEINPKNDDIYVSMSRVYIDFLKKYEKGINFALKAIEINPKKDVAYHNIGVGLTSLNRYEEAIQYCQKAIDLNSKRDDTYGNLGICFTYLGKYGEALKSYKQVLKINPKYKGIYFIIGSAYIYLQEYKKGIEFINKEVEINPKNAQAFYNMGVAYINMGEYQKSIEYTQKAISLNYQNYQIYYNLVIAYYSLEEYAKAIEFWIEALAFQEDDSLDFINLFELQLTQKQPFDQALERKYSELFQNKKESFIKYEMLKILQDMVQNQEVNIEGWVQKYRGIGLGGWSFDALREWIDGVKDEVLKVKLREAVEVFEGHGE